MLYIRVSTKERRKLPQQVSGVKDVDAFTSTLPRIRIIPLAEFDPFAFI